MRERGPRNSQNVDPVRVLPTILGELGLSRDALAAALGVAKESVDNWCIRRASVSLPNLARLIRYLESRGVDRGRVRALLFDNLVRLGLGEDIVDRYVGHQRVPPRNNVCAIIAQNLRNDLNALVSARTRERLFQMDCEVVLLDCGTRSATRRLYLEQLVPALSPTGLILMRFSSGFELDTIATRLAHFGIPCVYVGARPQVLPRNAAFVAWDEHGLGFSAGKGILEAGFEGIGVLTRDREVCNMRVDGFCQAVAESVRKPVRMDKLQVAPANNPGDVDVDAELIGEVRRWLRRCQPEAVFLSDTSLALALIRAVEGLNEARFRDLCCVTPSAAGPTAAWLEILTAPLFTVVDIPVAFAARACADLVIKLGGSDEIPLGDRTVRSPCAQRVVIRTK